MASPELELGYGDGYGDGYGSGYGDGSGNGDGYGDGYGYGYGDGDGDGDGEIELEIPESAAWEAWHFLGKHKSLRNGGTAEVGQHLHEDAIRMCSHGLHASLSREDAGSYKPYGGVLTRVKVWGRVKVAKDKLVATDREIVEIY